MSEGWACRNMLTEERPRTVPREDQGKSLRVNEVSTERPEFPGKLLALKSGCLGRGWERFLFVFVFLAGAPRRKSGSGHEVGCRSSLHNAPPVQRGGAKRARAPSYEVVATIPPAAKLKMSQM